MYARKVAGLGHFPDHQHGGLVEVHRVSSTGLARRNSVAFKVPWKSAAKVNTYRSESPELGHMTQSGGVGKTGGKTPVAGRCGAGVTIWFVHHFRGHGWVG
ncbi:hypothetical protein SBA6_500053 [Candidatus Sulfopaludibacter sp. SbA6]|nr:hypothetical protein SBA6_500053 [Candidatus Sulfopaludibacter sp. SbA6]